MLDGYIYNALRTPFGRHAGALARMRPDDMLAAVISEVVKQSPFGPEKIEDVVVGCANQAGEDSRCVARHAGLLAGLPIEVAGSVLQRNCGSGLNAIIMAAQAVTCGEGEVMVAGGVESMSRAPFVMTRPRRRSVATAGSSIRRSAHASRTRRSSASSAPTQCPRPRTTWRATIRSPV